MIFVASCVSACRISAAVQSPNCYPETIKLSYPPLGRAANVWGDVTLNVHIDSDGKATVATVNGHPVLTVPSKEMLQSAKFPAGCKDEDETILIIFRLRDLEAPYQEDAVEILGPGKYGVTGTRLIISDPPAYVQRRPWWKRLWKKIS